MKNKFPYIYITMLIFILSFSILRSESLEIIKTVEIPSHNFNGEIANQDLRIGGVYLENSTVYISSNLGLLSLLSSEDTLIMLVESEPYGDSWWGDFKVAKNKNALFSPGLIWSNKNLNNLLVYDNYISSFYTIDLHDKKNITTNIWEKDFSKYNLRHPSIYNEMILYFIFSDYTDKLVGISGYNLSDFQMIFECPPKLKIFFDSLWTDPYSSPVFNPTDSTIWIAFDYYNYVYIIDMQGELLDSVKVDSPDFKIPQPPISRIKSNAVFQDWASKTTPVTSFHFVHPGYFLLQFYIGDRNTNIGIYTTLLWNVESKKLVKLDINKFWKVVGVQDNRIIFKDYIKDNDEDKTVLYITRIKP